MANQNDTFDTEPPTYLSSIWFHFLPFYIFIALAIINLILLVFSGMGAGPILIFIILAILMGLLLWWLCSINQSSWAWFLLLLPVILALLAGAVSGGVASGMIAYDMSKAAKLY